jgi:hypothetical protein
MQPKTLTRRGYGKIYVKAHITVFHTFLYRFMAEEIFFKLHLVISSVVDLDPFGSETSSQIRIKSFRIRLVPVST